VLRGDADYWHQEFSNPNALPWIERVEKLRTDILRHPLVQRSEPED
jgi:hypothetical protein